MNDKQSFIELVNDLYTENRETSLNRLICEFKNQNQLICLLIKECDLNTNDDLINDQFINLLINLPQITGNLFQLLNDQLFVPENYFKILCTIIYKTLNEVQ